MQYFTYNQQDASEMDDDELLSSSEGFYFNRRSLLATPEEC